MAGSYKAVLRVRLKTDTTGVINIRKIENRKTTYYTLKIQCPVKYWNDKSGTVRKNTEIDYESINEDIADKLKEFEQYTDQQDYTPLPTKKSFIFYFENYLKRYGNTGSRIKYQTVLNKFKKYLESENKTDILFHEIDTNLIYDFRNYTLKKATVNTTTHYLKLIKQVLNKAIADNYYTYLRHPFLTVDFKTTKIKKNALSEAEIKKLISTPITEDNYLYDTRNKFLTQIFLQGLRISDLQLLKYSSIVGDSIQYNMVKTANPMTVFISDIVWKIFIYQYKQYLKKHNIITKAIPQLEQKLQSLKDVVKKEYGIDTGIDLVIDAQIKGESIEPIFKEINTLQNQIFESYKIQIKEFGRHNPNIFIFDFLQDIDLKTISIERKYKILKNKSIVYNRHLKELQKVAKIDTVFKSHLSRHSYASLLLNSDVDVYNISAALGHSRLSITENYLSGFDNTKTAGINKQLSDKFI